VTAVSVLLHADFAQALSPSFAWGW